VSVSPKTPSQILAMGNLSCCPQSGYSTSETCVFPYSVEQVWETLLYPEWELRLLRLEQPPTTLVSLHRVETGPVQRGSQWREERRFVTEIPLPRGSESRSAAPLLKKRTTAWKRPCMRRRHQSATTLVTVTDLNPTEHSISYSFSISPRNGSDASIDVDLQGGTICKNITIRSDENSSNEANSCLVVVTSAFRFDSWYGCMEEYLCARRVMKMVKVSTAWQFQEMSATVANAVASTLVK
jgi:hypothetical protein